MNANTNNMQQMTPAGSQPVVDAGTLKCMAFQALKSWQVDRYRKAVNENRWFMSQKQYRWIDWTEAEQDFLSQGYYGCAEKWRHEYCGEICPFKNNCLLALRLVKEAPPVSLPKIA